MRSIEEVLNFAETLVYGKTGEHLNDLQRIILSECCQSTKKTYDQIASEQGYSANYIKQGVGPKLWKLLSQTTGEKVTKSNFYSVLERQSISYNYSQKNRSSIRLVQNTLELPLDNVPLNSPFYIERIPHESRCYEEISRPGAFIRIKAPRQMGKSSLMYRILDHAKKQNHQTALIHFQQAESNILNDLDYCLRWFCANLSRQLNLELKLEEYWDEFLGSKMSCTCYLQENILAKIKEPLVIALEEVNEIIEYPQVAKEFLTLLRFWHEKTKNDPLWQKLRLIMVHSTEIYIPLDINQSPLNVGLRIELEPFNREQVEDLVLRHNLTLESQDLDRLMALVGGFPYLTRRALYHLARRDITLKELWSNAPTDSGIYRNHLQRHLRNLESDSELIQALQAVLQADNAIAVEQIVGFKLHSMGLVKLHGNQVSISCDLYRKYFLDHTVPSFV
ncbi:MAG: AAA-like domain-containing protein [Cyanobacteria bacterium P01_F01_bin.143]